MRERHVRLQWLQVKVWTGIETEATRVFLLCRFSLRLSMRFSSTEDTAWWMVWRHVSRSAASVVHWWWSMSQAPRAFLRVSLHRVFGGPMLRWPEESSPYRAILGKRWSSILETCPTQRSCDFSSMASILVSFACSRTSTFVTNSLQWMLRMVRRQRWCKLSRSRSWQRK